MRSGMAGGARTGHGYGTGRRLRLAACLIALTFLTAACGLFAAPPHKTRVVPQVGGTIVSAVNEGVVVPGVRLYKLTYWARRVKVVAYVTEPTRPGHYPLLVNLHGGFIASQPGVTHYNLTFSMLEITTKASTNLVELYPDYQGYGGSLGQVRGPMTDTVDTLDAIRATEHLGETNNHRIYLLGFSLGGDIALLLASGRLSGIQAVAVVSPYVGETDNMLWDTTHQGSLSLHELGIEAAIESNFGTSATGTINENPEASVYTRRSPDIAAIHAPILLQQGTADGHVVWQTVQLFASRSRRPARHIGSSCIPAATTAFTT